MKNLIMLTVASGLLFFPLNVFALDKLDIAKLSGLKWGASEKEFEVIGGKILGRDNSGWSQGSTSFFPRSREEIRAGLTGYVTKGPFYQFFKGKFFFFEKRVPIENFQLLKKSFTQKYGKPTAEKDFHNIEYSFVWIVNSAEICLYDLGNGKEVGVQYEYLPIAKERKWKN